jgi:hypothetical protein
MAKKSRSAGTRQGGQNTSTGNGGPAGSKDRWYAIAPDLGELCLRSPNSKYVTGTTASGEQAIIRA